MTGAPHPSPSLGSCALSPFYVAELLTIALSPPIHQGCKEVTVLNRSLPRAEALAAEFPEVKFNIHLMPDLMKCVEASDVVFAASGSEELLLQKADIQVGAPLVSHVHCLSLSPPLSSLSLLFFPLLKKKNGCVFFRRREKKERRPSRYTP